MKEKIQHLMESEGLRPSQLAARLGIKAAGISHILSGRNNPSFDMLQRILQQFPTINPDWLLLDDPQMYRAASAPAALPISHPSPSTPPMAAAPGGDLFDRTPTDRPTAYSVTPTPSAATVAPTYPMSGASAPAPSQCTATSSDDERQAPLASPLELLATRSGARVERIVIFYEDRTFETYLPTRR